MNDDHEIIYHYTTQQGLLDIFKSKTLWATNLHYLNDATEFLYSTDILEGVLERRMSEIWPPDFLLRREAIQKFAAGLIGQDTKSAVGLTGLDPIGEGVPENEEQLKYKFYKFLKQSLSLIRGTPIYLCSFSEDGDKLDQWRGYCGSNDGFSIGFDFVELRKLGLDQGYELKQCIYEPDLQKKIIESFVDSIVQAFLKNGRDDEAEPPITKFWSIAPTLKHKAFVSEKEWRLISKAVGLGEGRTQFRNGKSMITPYLQFELGKKMPIKKIYIGPTPHSALSHKSLKMLCLANDLKETKVEISDIPYRAW